jgi:Transposase IS4
VYCLSNDTNNFQFDECCRRGDHGIITIPRPLLIADYNRFMGGVDLADMIRLSCNCTIMYTRRWWLKPFFYLLDVATGNAMVLYNEFLRLKAEENGTEFQKVNIAKFKLLLVEDLIGGSIEALLDSSLVSQQDEHVCIPIEGKHGRHRCAYCSLMSRNCRTRFQCKACGVPLCSVGNGRVENDCFSEAHETED